MPPKQQEQMNEAYIRQLSRSKLQSLAKKRKIKANLTSESIIEQLLGRSGEEGKAKVNEKSKTTIAPASKSKSHKTPKASKAPKAPKSPVRRSVRLRTQAQLRSGNATNEAASILPVLVAAPLTTGSKNPPQPIPQQSCDTADIVGASSSTMPPPLVDTQVQETQTGHGEGPQTYRARRLRPTLANILRDASPAIATRNLEHQPAHDSERINNAAATVHFSPTTEAQEATGSSMHNVAQMLALSSPLHIPLKSLDEVHEPESPSHSLEDDDHHIVDEPEGMMADMDEEMSERMEKLQHATEVIENLTEEVREALREDEHLQERLMSSYIRWHMKDPGPLIPGMTEFRVFHSTKFPIDYQVVDGSIEEVDDYLELVYPDDYPADPVENQPIRHYNQDGTHAVANSGRISNPSVAGPSNGAIVSRKRAREYDEEARDTPEDDIRYQARLRVDPVPPIPNHASRDVRESRSTQKENSYTRTNKGKAKMTQEEVEAMENERVEQELREESDEMDLHMFADSESARGMMPTIPQSPYEAPQEYDIPALPAASEHGDDVTTRTTSVSRRPLMPMTVHSKKGGRYSHERSPTPPVEQVVERYLNYKGDEWGNNQPAPPRMSRKRRRNAH
ncbi:hypothetical protein AMATHDRAFT_46491 [Amanita thiersii Skay4041]|uniref:Uncharacterized protein n=1 Tax=Amanita thiersii Skay4041 TaxID=703135 RepID=A0A2A9NPT4_9AGAR|nr:hypothetical protein AMATHDRAFT_46491 [Amanita thiersii Skay4041]